MQDEIKNTPVWDLYEKNRQYLNSKSFYTTLDRAFRFYEGKQWDDNAPKDMPLPVVNIIEPIVNYKVATVAQKQLLPVLTNSDYSDTNFAQLADVICDKLNKYFEKLWEQNEMDTAMWDSSLESAIGGSVGFYSFWDDDTKQIKHELKSGTEVLFGDEQQTDVQRQPYILIPYRRYIGDIRAEAKNYGFKDIDQITTDEEYQEQAGDYAKTEVNTDSKCLAILKMWKQNGTVWISKSTRTVEFLKPTDTKLKLYPLAWLTWGSLKGSCRGRGEVTALIPNQVEINKNYARRAVAIMQTAYPKIVYRKDAIDAEDVTTVGAVIGIENAGVQNVNEAITYLQPAQQGADATNFCNELISTTKDLAGASDAALGNVNPEQVSGRAILAVQDSSAAVLNRQVARMKDYVEDIVRIWWDIYETYEPEGIQVAYEETNPQTNQPYTIAENIPSEIQQKLKFNVRIDVSPNNAFSIYALEQSIEALFSNQLISFEEFAEMLPSGSNIPKAKLQQLVMKRQEQAQKEQMAFQQGQEQQKQIDKEDLNNLAAIGEQYKKFLSQKQGNNTATR